MHITIVPQCRITSPAVCADFGARNYVISYNRLKCCSSAIFNYLKHVSRGVEVRKMNAQYPYALSHSSTVVLKKFNDRSMWEGGVGIKITRSPNNKWSKKTTTLICQSRSSLEVNFSIGLPFFCKSSFHQHVLSNQGHPLV